MSVTGKARTLAWFARRPDHWSHARSLVARKVRRDLDGPALRSQARKWAQSRATSLESLARTLGYSGEISGISQLIGESRYDEAQARILACPVKMGGAADVRLLYFSCEAIGATRVIETGVAYGWSSLAILASLSKRDGAMLTSVDMPYPKMNNDDWVGIAVPDDLRKYWRLIKQPDRNGLRRALELQDRPPDLCHYDSDKSYYGRVWAYPLLWNALRPGGIFITDDIQDNFAFKEFAEGRKVDFFVVESHGKFVGLSVKP